MSASHNHGGCTCGFVRYRIDASPMFVHCCHCRWCQRETGAAFAHNALIEAGRVALLRGRVEVIDTPSASGKGQKISRCPRCHFLRVGTLDEPDLWPPDIHIYTASKQPWVILPPGTPAVPAYYKASEYWPAASLQRREMLRAKPSGE